MKRRLPLFLLLLAGCASGRPLAEVADEINRTHAAGPLRIEIGDTIDVRFPFKTDWNQQTRVRPDGRASFLLLDEVEVVGLTVAELDARLTERYRTAKDAVAATTELTVNVVPGAATAANGLAVYVFGEVHTPGAVPLDGRSLTLIEALGRVGGPLKATARMSQTLLIRRLPDDARVVAWVIDAETGTWGTAPPVFLRPNDIVFVPNTPIDDLDIFVDQYFRQLIPVPLLPVRY